MEIAILVPARVIKNIQCGAYCTLYFGAIQDQFFFDSVETGQNMVKSKDNMQPQGEPKFVCPTKSEPKMAS